MSEPVEVRRVRSEEWREVRDLRVEAVGDPDAAIAFLTTRDQELARDDAFWRMRAAGAALGDDAAQFIADDAGRWVGTATVLLRPPHADVVGVYVAPGHRGTGVLGRLLDAAGEWAQSRGIRDLALTTHVENRRAQAAYRKAGFAPTGETITSTIGPEVVMRRRASVNA